mgnify:CR=1 FL=1
MSLLFSLGNQPFILLAADMKQAIALNERDTVCTVLDAVEAGETIEVLRDGQVIQHLEVKEAVPKYFKVTLVAQSEDDEVIKYGEIIGQLNHDVQIGDLIHVDALRSIKV